VKRGNTLHTLLNHQRFGALTDRSELVFLFSNIVIGPGNKSCSKKTSTGYDCQCQMQRVIQRGGVNFLFQLYLKKSGAQMVHFGILSNILCSAVDTYFK
jgi:hypothetical protein